MRFLNIVRTAKRQGVVFFAQLDALTWTATLRTQSQEQATPQISMNDDYRRQMLTIADKLRAQGIRPYTSAPPIYRLAWTLGLHIRPPLYQSFASLALGTGTWFGVVWGTLMWFTFWPISIGVKATGMLVLLAGASFGLVMAGYYRWKAARLQLPPLES